MRIAARIAAIAGTAALAVSTATVTATAADNPWVTNSPSTLTYGPTYTDMYQLTYTNRTRETLRCYGIFGPAEWIAGAKAAVVGAADPKASYVAYRTANPLPETARTVQFGPVAPGDSHSELRTPIGGQDVSLLCHNGGPRTPPSYEEVLYTSKPGPFGSLNMGSLGSSSLGLGSLNSGTASGS